MSSKNNNNFSKYKDNSLLNYKNEVFLTLTIPVYQINPKKEREIKYYEVYIKECYQRALFSLELYKLLDLNYFQSLIYSDYQRYGMVMFFLINSVIFTRIRKWKFSNFYKFFLVFGINMCVVRVVHFFDEKKRFYKKQFLFGMGLSIKEIKYYQQYIKKFSKFN